MDNIQESYIDKNILALANYEYNLLSRSKEHRLTEDEKRQFIYNKYKELGGRIMDLNRPRIYVEKSERMNKKYLVLLPDGCKVHYGDTRYEDFTQHKDVRRKQRYLVRHRNDNIVNPHKPGFWARWHLWNKPSGETSLREAIQRAQKWFSSYKDNENQS